MAANTTFSRHNEKKRKSIVRNEILEINGYVHGGKASQPGITYYRAVSRLAAIASMGLSVFLSHAKWIEYFLSRGEGVVGFPVKILKGAREPIEHRHVCV